MAAERLNFRKKYSKIFLLRNAKEDEAETLHKYSTYIIFFIVVAHVLSLLWQQRFHIHVLIMGKVETAIYFCVTADNLTKVLLKCFWSSPLPTI